MRLGFQINAQNTPYSSRLADSAVAWAERHGHTLHLFVGAEYGPGNESANTLYGLINPTNIDGLVMAAGTLFNRVDPASVDMPMLTLHRIPTVAIGGNVPGIPRVMPDNASGISDVVDHLVTVHSKARIAFVKGIKGSTDSEERYGGWLSAVIRHGLPCDPELVWQGDYGSRSGYEALMHFMAMDNPPDALIFANDDMAVGGVEAYGKLGLDMDGSVAIIGFDDTPFAGYGMYDLTSIDQSYDVMVDTAFGLLMGLLRGDAVEASTYMVPTTPIYRGSCGCGNRYGLNRTYGEAGERMAMELVGFMGFGLSEGWEKGFLGAWKAMLRDNADTDADLLNDALNRAGDYLFSLADDDSTRLAISEVLREAQGIHFGMLKGGIIGSAINTEAELTLLNLASRHITTASDMEIMKGNLTHWAMEMGMTQVRLVSGGRLVYDLASFRKGMYQEYDVPEGRLLPAGFPGRTEGSWLLFPLIMGSAVYGCIMFGYGEARPFMYEFLCTQVATALHSLRLFNELHGISTRDELTGILNRRGFMELGNQNFQLSIRNGLAGVIFYIDLDGMKGINDVYGHASGDAALKATARILMESTRDTDVVGRVGGDEFVVLAVNASEADAVDITDRILAAVARFNKTTTKAWGLGLSMGFHAYGPEDGCTFNAALASADARLYEAKKRKREDMEAYPGYVRGFAP